MPNDYSRNHRGNITDEVFAMIAKPVNSVEKIVTAWANSSAIQHDMYETPQSIPWTLGDKPYYDSDIIYIAVKKAGN